MLLTEWNLDDAIAVAREEAREDGYQEGRINIARNALVKGATLEFVQKITGLDFDILMEIQANL